MADVLVDCANASNVTCGNFHVVWISQSIACSEQGVHARPSERPSRIVHDRIKIVVRAPLEIGCNRIDFELSDYFAAWIKRNDAAIGNAAVGYGCNGSAIKREEAVAVWTFVFVNQAELVTPFVLGLTSEAAAR
jgi:hypothetical protein